MQSHPEFGEFCEIRLPLQHRLVTYRLHIWQLDRPNGGVAPTVTSDNVDLLLCLCCRSTIMGLYFAV